MNPHYQPPCIECSRAVRAVCIFACDDYDKYIVRLEREAEFHDRLVEYIQTHRQEYFGKPHKFSGVPATLIRGVNN